MTDAVCGSVVIAGTRTITDYDAVVTAIEESGYTITEVVSGTASGVDTLGERWASEHDIDINRFDPDDYADPDNPEPKFHRRNRAMAEYADALIAVWNGSSGTAHMIECAKEAGIPYTEHRTDMGSLSDF